MPLQDAVLGRLGERSTSFTPELARFTIEASVSPSNFS